MINMVKPLLLKEGREDGKEERRKKWKQVRTATTRKYNFLPLQPLPLEIMYFSEVTVPDWNMSLSG